MNIRWIGMCAATLVALGGCGGGGGASATTDGSSDGGAGSGPGSATLQWTAPADSRIVGYRVYYGTASGTYLQQPGEGLAAAGSSYTAKGLAQGVTYYFVVTSYDAAGAESGYSEEASKLIE